MSWLVRQAMVDCHGVAVFVRAFVSIIAIDADHIDAALHVFITEQLQLLGQYWEAKGRRRACCVATSSKQCERWMIVAFEEE